MIRQLSFDFDLALSDSEGELIMGVSLVVGVVAAWRGRMVLVFREAIARCWSCCCVRRSHGAGAAMLDKKGMAGKWACGLVWVCCLPHAGNSLQRPARQLAVLHGRRRSARLSSIVLTSDRQSTVMWHDQSTKRSSDDSESHFVKK